MTKFCKKSISILLSILTIVSLFAIMPITASAADLGWHRASLSEISNGDTVIVTMETGNGVYGLSNVASSGAGGTSDNPAAIAFTELDNDDFSQTKLFGSDENLAACTWTVGRSGDSLTFSTSSGDMLYCINDNNGVRVGSGDNTTFTVDENSGFLQNTATSRYLGVYNKQDWRCYTDISSVKMTKSPALLRKPHSIIRFSNAFIRI